MIVPINLEKSKAVKYDVVIDELPILTFNRKVAIVTNTTVSALHLETLKSKTFADELFVVTIEDGEEFKNLATVERILNELFENKLDRKSLLIALGGGVIGDMTGFTASLYQRGIGFIQVPTTLLAQVDASVGGKTGVNNTYGKNLIGAFYQPEAVYIDTEFLKTLPPREFAAGIAEIVKMAVMFDKAYFDFLMEADFREKVVLEKVIQRSVELKAEVVNLDERESGIRAVLNYGHTFGHVVENETAYKTYLHGEAVAIGMMMANALAVELNMMTEEEMGLVEHFLNKHQLPTTYEVKDVDAFYDKFFLDKKAANNKLKFILPKGIGGHMMRNDVSEDILKKVLKAF
ncbi:MAG: 3-dehydroquinate synthase (EC [uncultured Sulfurovum sp.]|uniref:3-dehydroquinate synthase n=1 Tax=uncultured Sulfurovum sp. TaxID=269237 RepID=A0A6S6SSM1_9BACT|nr:MAG: 3-dehydroquinate synthase (EC [uncultured Sulfurovum sp.]